MADDPAALTDAELTELAHVMQLEDPHPGGIDSQRIQAVSAEVQRRRSA